MCEPVYASMTVCTRPRACTHAHKSCIPRWSACISALVGVPPQAISKPKKPIDLSVPVITKKKHHGDLYVKLVRVAHAST